MICLDLYVSNLSEGSGVSPCLLTSVSRARNTPTSDTARLAAALQSAQAPVGRHLADLLPPVQCRLVCWCGQELPKWVLGNTFCGRAFPGGPQGHKLELKRMECNWCRAKRDISLSQAEADKEQWQPIDRVCPACHHDLHGAECRKAGSDVVSVH